MKLTQKNTQESTQRTVVNTFLTTITVLVVTGAYYSLYQAVQHYTVF